MIYLFSKFSFEFNSYRYTKGFYEDFVVVKSLKQMLSYPLMTVFLFPVNLVVIAHFYAARYHGASIYSGDRPAPTLLQGAEQIAWWTLANVVCSLLGNMLAMTYKGKDWHGGAGYKLNAVDPGACKLTQGAWNRPVATLDPAP
jgi:uncharacterized membrane protein YjdF